MQLKESTRIAVDVIRTHKMRSFLTLLGIIIGVTSIIGMQALIQGIQLNMKQQMEQLGATVFQVQKYPVTMGGDHDRDKYRNRKDITLKESEAIKKYCTYVENVGPEDWEAGRVVRYRDKKTSPTIWIAGGEPAFFPNNSYFIGEGRAFNEIDCQYNRAVAVIGMDVVEQLFPYQSPIGEDISVDGHHYQVIGIIEKQGARFGESNDNRIAVPIGVFQKYYGKNRSINITVSAKSPELFEASQEQVTGVLRAVRKVPPGEDSDFAIWSSQSLYKSFNDMTAKIRIGAIVIVSFALLVAGIGIMNIMLVSVHERTREIGIRRAIGAQQKDILYQFLVESILLSELGGLIGMLFGVLIGVLASALIKVSISIPIFTMLLGFFFCSVVGIVFGVYPAMKASKLDPIESLRYE